MTFALDGLLSALKKEVASSGDQRFIHTNSKVFLIHKQQNTGAEI